MDAASKAFILMIVIAVVFGLIVVVAIKEYRIPDIYKSNRNYYSAITEESLKKTYRVVSEMSPQLEKTTDSDY